MTIQSFSLNLYKFAKSMPALFRIIDTSDCVGDIRSLVENRRLSMFLALSRWMSVTTPLFGAFAFYLVDHTFQNQRLYIWYGLLLLPSVLMWVLSYRPKLTMANLSFAAIQNRSLSYVLSILALWIALDLYVALNYGKEVLMPLALFQLIYATCNALFFINSRLLCYGFFLTISLFPLMCLAYLFTSYPDEAWSSGLTLFRGQDAGLLSIFPLFAIGVIFLCLRLIIGNMSGSNRITALYEISNERLARVNSDLESESNTDYLTGVANRRAYESDATRELSRAIRTQRSFVIMVIDIDYFKLFNDRYGHGAGDRVLNMVATQINENLRRPTDILARYGGEEFVVVVNDISHDYSRKLAEKFISSVRNKKVPNVDSSASEHLTVSVGMLYCIPKRHAKLEQLFKFADRALYEAKKQGRNRLVDYDDIPLESHSANSAKIQTPGAE